MIVVFSVILFVLGLLGAESLVTKKLPMMVNLLVKLQEKRETIGVLGMVFGAVYGVLCLDSLGLLRAAPGHFIVMLASALIAIGLGMVFGLDVISRNLKNTDFFLLKQAERFRQLVLRMQKECGVAGVILGLLTFFAHV